jgi:hypothetical protein
MTDTYLKYNSKKAKELRNYRALNLYYTWEACDSVPLRIKLLALFKPVFIGTVNIRVFDILYKDITLTLIPPRYRTDISFKVIENKDGNHIEYNSKFELRISLKDIGNYYKCVIVLTDIFEHISNIFSQP